MLKQTIAIIGARGSMGSAISKSLSKGNYRLLLCSGDEKKVRVLAKEIKQLDPLAEVESLECPYNASWEADIILLSVKKSLALSISINNISVQVHNNANENTITAAVLTS